jgi:hypothetical protein
MRKHKLRLLKVGKEFGTKERTRKSSRSDRIAFPTHSVGRLWTVLERLKLMVKRYPSICPKADVEAEVRLPDGRTAYVFYYGEYRKGSSGMPAHTKLALQRKEASLLERGYPYLKLKRTLTTEQLEIAVRRWVKTTSLF